MQSAHFGLLLFFGGSTINLLAEGAKSRKFSVVPDHITTDPSDEKNVTGENAVSGPLKNEVDEVPKAAETAVAANESKSKHLIAQEAAGNEIVADPQEGTSDEVQPTGHLNAGVRLWSMKDIHLPFCRNCKGILDYQLYMAEMGNSAGPKMTLVVLALFLIWLLGTTATDFFVPPLFYWAECLKLEPEMAGATLLALGNGAPDIFAVNMAAHKDDLPLALSEMLGSNMFTLCITGGSVVLACHYLYATSDGIDISPVQGYGLSMQGNRMRFTIAIYFLALAILSWNLMHGKPTVGKALLLPGLYVLYLFSLNVFSRSGKRGSLEEVAMAHGVHSENHGGGPPPLVGLHPPKTESVWEFAWWLLCLPTYAIRWVCIPPADQHWCPLRRVVSSVAPISIFAFCVLTNIANIQKLSMITLLGLTMLAVLASVAMYLSSTDKPELPKFYPILPFTAMISSILWLGAIAGELTALVEAIGFYMQVPRLRLGFSTIAWGNSLGDLLCCVATVRKGQADMAITAVFAGPLIDDLIAFGLAMSTLAFGQQGEKEEPICGEACPMMLKLPIMTSIVFVSVSVVLLSLIFAYPGRGPRIGVAALVVWYSLFLIIVLVVQGVDAPETPIGGKKSKG